MPTLAVDDILNAPLGDVLVSIPLGGVFVLKQLLAQYIAWDTEDPADVDRLDAILAQTMELTQGVTSVTNRVFNAVLPQDFVIAHDAEATVDLNVVFIDSNYASFSSPTLTLVAGTYIFFATYRASNMGNGRFNWPHQLRYRRSSDQQLVRVFESYYGSTQNNPSMSVAFTLADPSPMYMTWRQLSGFGDVGLLAQTASTQFQVVRLAQ
jgi:hypothetical protein